MTQRDGKEWEWSGVQDWNSYTPAGIMLITAKPIQYTKAKIPKTKRKWKPGNIKRNS